MRPYGHDIQPLVMNDFRVWLENGFSGSTSAVRGESGRSIRSALSRNIHDDCKSFAAWSRTSWTGRKQWNLAGELTPNSEPAICNVRRDCICKWQRRECYFGGHSTPNAKIRITSSYTECAPWRMLILRRYRREHRSDRWLRHKVKETNHTVVFTFKRTRKPEQPRFPPDYHCPPNGTLARNTNRLATTDDMDHTDPPSLDQYQSISVFVFAPPPRQRVRP